MAIGTTSELTSEQQAAAAPLAGDTATSAAAVSEEPDISAMRNIGAGIDALAGGLPPEPPRGGISESPRDQLLRQMHQNADKIIAGAANPSGPGAWARALVAGVQSALSGAAAVGPIPRGAGALYGASRAAAAAGAETRAAQERSDRLKQQAIINDREERRLKMEEERWNAINFSKGVLSQSSLRHASRDAQDDFTKSVMEPYNKAMEEKGSKVVRGNMTWNELVDLAKTHATPGDVNTPPDPMGLKWLADQNVHMDGWRDVLDEKGDVMAEKDKSGQPTGNPVRQQTYQLRTFGDPIQLSDQTMADQINKVEKTNFKSGDTIPAEMFTKFSRDVQLQYVQEQAMDTALLAAKKPREEIEKIEDTDAYRQAIPYWLHWMNDAGGDPAEAMQNLQDAVEEVGPDGNPTPHAMQVRQQYDVIVRGLGPTVVKTLTDSFEKENLERIKQNAKDAKNKPLEIEGDPKLEGEAYVNSLPPGRKDLVRQLGSGRINAGQLARVAGGRDGQQLLAEVAHAYPDFDSSKIAKYPDTVKEFNIGKIGNQIRAVNTGLPHLDKLYTDVTAMPSAAFPVIGAVEAAFGSKTAAAVRTTKTQASQELAAIYATGAVTDQEHREFADEIKGATTPWELKNNIVNIVDLLKSRLQAIQDQWTAAAPSQRYLPPRPIVSQTAKAAMDHIAALEGGAPTPATAAVTGPAGTTAPPKQTYIHNNIEYTSTDNGETWVNPKGDVYDKTGKLVKAAPAPGGKE